MVMGSYAQFMWEAEEDEDIVSIPAAEAMVAAFQVWIDHRSPLLCNNHNHNHNIRTPDEGWITSIINKPE